MNSLARWRGLDRDRSFYPTVPIVIAWYLVRRHKEKQENQVSAEVQRQLDQQQKR